MSSISDLPQEVVQHILSFSPLNSRYAQVNHQFHNIHRELLRQNVRQIFEQCSTGQTALNTFINGLKKRHQIANIFVHILKELCQITEFQGDRSHLDTVGIDKIHQLIVQKIQNFGISCPNTYLSSQEIREYNVSVAAIEDGNLQRAWGAIHEAAIAAVPAGMAPLNPLAANESAANIRTWMDTNIAALQRIHELDLCAKQLTCIPREIALLTGLQKLYLEYNQIRELPVGIFNGLVELRWLSFSVNQIRELPAGIFNGLVRLRVLALGHNQIKKLPADIFNGLMGLQMLDLDNNQISELPVGIFDELIELQWLRLGEGNPQLLIFYKELCDFDLYVNTFNAFHHYVCKSAFAKFYQFAAQKHPLEEIIISFNALEPAIKNAIYGMVCEEARRPATDDLQWGEHHAFNDKGIFNGALKRYVRQQFEALSGEQKNIVYERVYKIAREDQGSAQQNFNDPNWKYDHAEDNVLWLIDAMMATPEALLS